MTGNGRRGAASGRLAYLATLYPALSHSFVQREVEALRKRDLEIHTFALHGTNPAHLLTDADREAQGSTYTVLPARWRSFAGAHLRALLTGPAAYLRTLAFALSRPPGGSHGRWWQLFYFLEAVPIWRECERRGLTHVHAHFTNPSGDVAQLVARLGVERAARGGGPGASAPMARTSSTTGPPASPRRSAAPPWSSASATSGAAS